MRTAAIGVLALLWGCTLVPPPNDDLALGRYEKANDLFDDARYEEAIPHYEFTIKYRDRIRDAYVRLARCHEALGHDPQAIEVLEQALRVDRGNTDARAALAPLYARQGRVDRALGEYRKLLKERPGDPAIQGEIDRLERLQSQQKGD